MKGKTVPVNLYMYIRHQPLGSIQVFTSITTTCGPPHPQVTAHHIIITHRPANLTTTKTMRYLIRSHYDATFMKSEGVTHVHSINFSFYK